MAPTQGDLRQGNVFIVGASSFPNAQKVPALVAALAGELRERMPGAATLRQQLELAFEANQRLVSIHPFSDGNGRTSRLLINYVQRYYGHSLTIVFRDDRQAYFAAQQQFWWMRLAPISLDATQVAQLEQAAAHGQHARERRRAQALLSL